MTEGVSDDVGCQTRAATTRKYIADTLVSKTLDEIQARIYSTGK